MSSSRPRPPTKIASGRFEIDKRLGAGCFGEVFRGVNTETKQEVAVKYEDLQSRTQQLEQEAAIMSQLRGPQAHGFAECFYFGREGRYHCMVMELLGRSLEDCVQLCKGKFQPLSTALCGEQLIQRVEYLHSKCIVHRDIKPENFMWGRRGKVHHLYMIDFGLSKRYFDAKHIPMRDKLSLTGTARYASINAHKGIEQSRRDDLEAVGHMLLYFLRGVLPWSGLDAKTKEEKYRRIRQKKEETPLPELCAGYPEEFLAYLQYCRALEFQDRPDYLMLRKMFRAVRDRLGGSLDHQLEWLEDSNVDVKTLEPLPEWSPLRQPDDVDTEASGKLKRSFCFCGGKAPRSD
mmetsp:Transcript_43088/g.127719  ORF Transcript_43088/g.127719 Transcript_43088/m.127719 type:complete len:347 (-) Transcript_43088:259-1299(-)